MFPLVFSDFEIIQYAMYAESAGSDETTNQIVYSGASFFM